MRAQGMSLETARALGLYRLYGSEMSMFTAKVRPVFSRKGLRWVEQLATQARWQEAEDLTGNRMIPVVFTPEGECVQDSSLIIDLLEARHREIPVESPDPVVKRRGPEGARAKDRGEGRPLTACAGCGAVRHGEHVPHSSPTRSRARG